MRRKRVVKVEVREIMPGCKRLSRAVTWSHFYFSRIPVVTVTRKEIWVGRAYCSHSGNRWWCPGVGWEQWSWWEVVREWKHCEGRNKRISWWIERAVGKQASTTGRVALPYPEMHKTGRKWKVCVKFVMLPRNSGEGGGNPLLYSCQRILWSEEPVGLLLSMGSHRVGHDWSDLVCMRALEKEMATHSSVLAWRIPGTGEPGGLPSMGSHRVGHDWSDLAAAAARNSNRDVEWAVE